MKNINLALRTFKNYRLYSVINIVGLSLSLACTIVISRYIYREITIDTHNENFDRIYATTCEIQNYATRTRLEYPWNINNEPGYIDPLTDPAIVGITKIITYPKDNLKIGDREFDADVMVTDSNFLKIFSYQLELGDRASALHNSSGALISKDFATKAPLSWWIYAMAALITASISLLTLLYQTIKAARTNPAVIMKSE